MDQWRLIKCFESQFDFTICFHCRTHRSGLIFFSSFLSSFVVAPSSGGEHVNLVILFDVSIFKATHSAPCARHSNMHSLQSHQFIRHSGIWVYFGGETHVGDDRVDAVFDEMCNENLQLFENVLYKSFVSNEEFHIFFANHQNVDLPFDCGWPLELFVSSGRHNHCRN